MSNPYRGDVEFKHNGQAYILRPTFAAIAEIEQATGKGFFALAKYLQAGEVKISDLATIAIIASIAECGAIKLTHADVEKIIEHEGAAALLYPVVELFKHAIGAR